MSAMNNPKQVARAWKKALVRQKLRRLLEVKEYRKN